MSRAVRLRRIFKPVLHSKADTSKSSDVHSKSSRLLLENGIVASAGNGLHSFLPFGLRSLKKISSLIDKELESVGAQKLALSSLTSVDLLKETGRYDASNDELFTVSDRKGRRYVLAPTHEEAITSLVASTGPHPAKSLPLLLYQMTAKYRDEPRPRYGVIRGREFLMKDLYTFDRSLEDAKLTYERVCQAYDNIFNQLGVKYVKVLGPTGNIGGSLSHEYHYPAAIGDDRLRICEKCKEGVNVELLESDECQHCGGNVSETHGIEVGHTFLLGTKYSSVLKANYMGEDGKEKPMEMGCYGIGVSRLIAASVEVLSKENQIRWPLAIAPFKVCIIPPKAGSKEEAALQYQDQISDRLSSSPDFVDDILIDDRTHLTIGKRLVDAKKTGYPYIIVLGKSALDGTPKFELQDLTRETNELLTFDQLVTQLGA